MSDHGHVPSFESVVEEYDEGRPGYPDELYDALGPLEGRLVLEGGAGTGIATRALLERGAQVVPFDIGPAMLGRAVERTRGLVAVIGDGGRAPFRDRCADLLCFAQSWHWLDPDRRCAEAARVLKPTGRWAGWWSHARADEEVWFETYWSLLEAFTVAERTQRDTDWGVELDRSGLFRVADRVEVSWTRHVSPAVFLAEVASLSFVAMLDEAPRIELLVEVERTIRAAFPDGELAVPHETWLWIAIRS